MHHFPRYDCRTQFWRRPYLLPPKSAQPHGLQPSQYTYELCLGGSQRALVVSCMSCPNSQGCCRCAYASAPSMKPLQCGSRKSQYARDKILGPPQWQNVLIAILAPIGTNRRSRNWVGRALSNYHKNCGDNAAEYY